MKRVRRPLCKLGRWRARRPLTRLRPPPRAVFSKEPVFTPCHHTFCADCIRDRLRNVEGTCAECRRPVAEEELQPNAMAINLLHTMKTCCIYKSNGCPWKGLVRDLAAHHKARAVPVRSRARALAARAGDGSAAARPCPDPGAQPPPRSAVSP